MRRINILFFLIVLLSVFSIAYAIDSWDTGFKVNAAETKQVYVTSSQDCHKVTNNNAYAIFVPTKTTGEWNAFDTYASNVVIGTCGLDKVFYSDPSIFNGQQQVLTSATATDDGGYILSFRFLSTSLPTPYRHRSTIIKTDASGNTCDYSGTTYCGFQSNQWVRTYEHASGQAYINSIKNSDNDNGYIAAGSLNGYAWLLKLDGIGGVCDYSGDGDCYDTSGYPGVYNRFSRVYGNGDESAARLIDPADGYEYVFVGETSSYGSGGKDIWLVRTSNTGLTCDYSGDGDCYDSGTGRFARVFGGPGDEHVCSVIIDHTSEYSFYEGYAIMATTTSFDSLDRDLWFIKTDTDGSTCDYSLDGVCHNGDDEWTELFGFNGADSYYGGSLTPAGGEMIYYRDIVLGDYGYVFVTDGFDYQPSDFGLSYSSLLIDEPFGTGVDVRAAWYGYTDNSKIAVSSTKDSLSYVYIYNYSNGGYYQSASVPNSRSRGVDWDPRNNKQTSNNSVIAVGGGGGNADVDFTDTSSWSKIGEANYETGYYDAYPAYSPDGSKVAVGYYNGHFKIFDTSSYVYPSYQTELQDINMGTSSYAQCRWSPDGTQLFVTSGEILRVYRTDTWAVVQSNLLSSGYHVNAYLGLRFFGDVHASNSVKHNAFVAAVYGSSVGDSYVKKYVTDGSGYTALWYEADSFTCSASDVRCASLDTQDYDPGIGQLIVVGTYDRAALYLLTEDLEQADFEYLTTSTPTHIYSVDIPYRYDVDESVIVAYEDQVRLYSITGIDNVKGDYTLRIGKVGEGGIFCDYVSGQGQCSSGYTWIKEYPSAITYGGPNTLAGSIYRTSDNGYITSNSMQSNQGSYAGSWLLKIDSSGNTCDYSGDGECYTSTSQFSRMRYASYPVVGYDLVWASDCIEQTSDGGYFAGVVFYNNSNYRVYPRIYKTNNQGLIG